MTGIDWSLVLSGVATSVAVVTFMRVWLQELPTVELIVTRDEREEPEYWLSVSNPSRRLIILDRGEVIAPRPGTVETVVILPMSTNSVMRGVRPRPGVDLDRPRALDAEGDEARHGQR